MVQFILLQMGVNKFLYNCNFINYKLELNYNFLNNISVDQRKFETEKNSYVLNILNVS